MFLKISRLKKNNLANDFKMLTKDSNHKDPSFSSSVVYLLISVFTCCSCSITILFGTLKLHQPFFDIPLNSSGFGLYEYVFRFLFQFCNMKKVLVVKKKKKGIINLTELNLHDLLLWC